MLQLFLGLWALCVGVFCFLYVFNKRLHEWLEERHQRHSGIDPNSWSVHAAEGINAILLPIIGAVFSIAGLVMVIGVVVSWF